MASPFLLSPVQPILLTAAPGMRAYNAANDFGHTAARDLLEEYIPRKHPPAPAHAQFPEPTHGRRAGRSHKATWLEILDPLRLDM
jgi:hypothetical protein